MAGFDRAKIEEGVRFILAGIGDDPDREGLR
jgi:GTP cyclohydrolase I